MATTKAQHKPLMIGLSSTWVLTILGFVWTTSSTKASFEGRINALETQVMEAKDRIEKTELGQTQILTDLAQIKTDILWIRKLLEDKND